MTECRVFYTYMGKRVEVSFNGTKKICDISSITYDGEGNVVNISTKPIIEKKYLLGISKNTGEKVYGGLWLTTKDKFTVLE